MHGRVVFVFLVFFLEASPGIALLPNGAEQFVANSNMLEGEERAHVFNNLLVSSSDGKYWVVNIQRGLEVYALIPIKDGPIPSVSLKQNVNKPLLEASYAVQGLADQKSASSSAGLGWLVSLVNSQKFQQLSTILEKESFDLDLIYNEAGVEAEVKSKASALKWSLQGMSLDFASLAEKVKALSAAELQLLNVEIKSKDALDLGDAYESVFDLVEGVNGKVLEYDSEISVLKNLISKSELDVEQKSYLIQLADPLGSSDTLSSAFAPFSGMASDNRQRLDTVFQSLPGKVSVFLGRLNEKWDRAQAYTALYGDDNSLKDKTPYVSLQDAVGDILSEAKEGQWKNQGAVNELAENWDRAQKLFNGKKFSEAKLFAEKAKASVLLVVRDGVQAIETPDGFPNVPELAVQVLVGLIVLAILGILFSNRKKIAGFFVQSPRETENHDDPFKM
ncbi:MAG: hypothetical protein HY393_01060 [Candidatus Diapherotrites archaeon]|nr:hypothetical protein [Candidatus Diapherotrites archaeon]